MLVRDRFEPTLTAPLPVAYLLRRVAGTDSLLAQLRLHGVVVERLSSRLDARGEQFAVDSLRKLPARDGHSDVRVEGKWTAAEHVVGEAGDYVVRTAQPLGVLAAILLEPQCDDGLTAWNFFDAALEPLMRLPEASARVFPVARITGALVVSSRLLP
jgi:dipeptidyl-peptidase 4